MICICFALYVGYDLTICKRISAKTDMLQTHRKPVKKIEKSKVAAFVGSIKL